MEILVIGLATHLEETQMKFGETHHYSQAGRPADAQNFIENGSIVFDFIIEEQPEQIDVYGKNPLPTVFLNTSTICLSKLNKENTAAPFFGFCGLPTFLNRQIFEVSVQKDEHKTRLKDICEQLRTDYRIVADRVGLITPRVICMIINEAYCTVQEGTATRDDIDKAMKLGTNYPFGPFEWCERIGIKNVCKLLDAVHQDTKDDRYKICQLLNEESKQHL